MFLNEHFLRSTLPEAAVTSASFPESARFSVDSRTLQPGDIFVALQGKHCDGHEYIGHAMRAGARGLIIDANKRDVLKNVDRQGSPEPFVAAVRDPLDALYRLACAWRAQYTNPVVAITGSVGKTSTKDLLAHMVRRHGMECLASHANQNTKLGIALNLLAIRTCDVCAILEVGINARGEMDDSARILRPNFAIITCVGHSHLEGLGCIAGVAQEKRAIFKYFSENDIGIINGDQPLLANIGYTHPVVKFGYKTTNQVQARKVRVNDNHIRATFKIYHQKFELEVPHVHRGLLSNTLAASAAAFLLGIPPLTIVAAAQETQVVPGRFERRKLKNGLGILIHDAYNSNPESAKAALAAFDEVPARGRRVLVIGDMLELGNDGPFWHRQLGRVLRKMSSSHHIVLVGSMVQWTRRALPVGASVDLVESWHDAVDAIERKLCQGSIVLIKGSQATGLCNIANVMSEPISSF